MRLFLITSQLLAALGAVMLLVLALFFNFNLVAEGMGLLALWAVLQYVDRRVFPDKGTE